ncbi:hypothetical protein L211DRAFT_845050 [Terfezia boudieri ATCC MYA-4762]|uniref:Uncharacterized protein n=1 Tax=Terfezia boudieri ATCC MYA-4762 TaxID=1051890 RepID=A0A3N4M1I0_9PEZI|nr:hypothetical protein L211DRAFT_845050 [Terfezia boudieri ATCC MYA-4762]
MSATQASGSRAPASVSRVPVRIPDLQPMPFNNGTQEAFNQYLRDPPHHLRFDVTRYDQYTQRLLQAQDSDCDIGLEVSKNEEKARFRVLQKFYLDEDEKLSCRDDNGRELRVPCNWQLLE